MIAGQLGGAVVFGLSIPERDLIGHAGFRDQSQGFQMGVEVTHDGERYPQLVFDDVPDGDVIGEADVLPGGHEASVFHQRSHSLHERSAEAEPGAAGGEPEGHLLLVRLGGDFHGLRYRRLAQVPLGVVVKMG